MTHKNYFVFKSASNYEIGLSMGEQFSNEAKEAINSSKNEDWEERKIIATKILEYSTKYFPEYIEELKGYAKGAEVDFLDLWTVSLENEATPAKCTDIITNKGMLIAHNEDAEKPGLENSICIVKKIIKDLTTLEIFWYNTLGGNSVGITSNGYVQTINTLLFTKTGIGISKNVIARYLFETKNPDESIKKVLSLPRASGYNHNIINKSGEIWNLELTVDNGILTKPSSPFTHSNHCLNVKTNVVDDYGTISRLNFANSIVKDQMNIDEVMELQKDSSKGLDKSLLNERTIGQMTIDLNLLVAKVWLKREDSLGWVDYSLDF